MSVEIKPHNSGWIVVDAGGKESFMSIDRYAVDLHAARLRAMGGTWKTVEELSDMLITAQSKSFEAGFDAGSKWGEKGGSETYEEALRKHADLPALSQVVQWVSVTERLPEELSSVIVCDDLGNVVEGTYTNRHWCEWDDTPIKNPTHWMPLPKHPRELASEPETKHLTSNEQ